MRNLIKFYTAAKMPTCFYKHARSLVGKITNIQLQTKIDIYCTHMYAGVVD